MSWDGLLSLLKDAAQEVQALVSAPPVACPQCGKPLTGGPNGEPHCTFDGWVWDGKPVRY